MLADQFQNVMTDFLSGGVAGAFTSTLFFPLNVLKIHSQLSLGVPFESPWTALRITLRERSYSARSFYRGVRVNALRSLVSWAIISASYEWMKKSF